MKAFTILFLLTFAAYGSEELSKLGFSKFNAEHIFEQIDKYKKDAPEYLKKLKDKETKVREEGLNFFMNLPAAPSEILVQALLKEKDKETRANLKKIITAALDKPTYEDWTQSVLAALTKHISKNNGQTKHLLEIVKRNQSPSLIADLEDALLKIYNASNDNLKLILFKSVSAKLSKTEIDSALSSALEELRFKAAQILISKGNSKALKIIINSLISEKKEIKEASAKLLTSVKNLNFDKEIENLINQLGVDSEQDRDKASLTLLAMPSSLSRNIEKVGINIYKLTENATLKVNFLNIIEQKISHLMDKPGYIGVMLVEQVDNGVKKIMIQQTFENTPAHKANVPANSQVLKINDVSFENSAHLTLIEHLKTLSAGTNIDLSIKKSDGEVVVKKICLGEKPNVNDRMIFEHWKKKNLESATSLTQ